ncbi:SAC3/GANP/Nin1/mts3/eIF-3 p25 family-domain-containing protein [Parasitella parasitica]|nr:SAC3/GANP/Nin1/mts3/eIF-3 p25 family-domain-containing protein [Parasitella parasitica]
MFAQQSNQNQMFNNQNSVFGNKPINNFQKKSTFSNQNTDNNNQNSVFFGQLTDMGQNRMLPNQRGRGRGRGNTFNSNTNNRGRKTWGQANKTGFNHFQQGQQVQQAQQQPKQLAFGQPEFDQGTVSQERVNYQGVFNQGKLNQGSFNQGTFNQGAFNQGALNKGTFNKGSFQQAAFQQQQQQQQQQQRQPKQLRQKRLHQSELHFQPQKAKHRPAEQSDVEQVTAADRAKRFGSTDKSDLYDQLRKMRVEERQQAIEDGLLPDPDNPTTLNEAISFRGTCTYKCPEFEIAERDYQNILEPFEKDEQGNVDPEKCVKAYRRSAAGVDQPLPSDVRTPETLTRTLDYLIDEILSDNLLEQRHAFLRDRTRSIRQDFTLQNLRDITAVAAHERIARFHILCVHEMCEVSQFSMQQELEQLNKVLLSLIEFYDDLRQEGIESENEAEFRAYHLLSHLRDQDIARQVQTLPVHIFRHPYMTQALKLRALSQRNNEIMETSSRRNKPENVEASQNCYSKLFKLIADESTPFLMACMMECHFSDIRKGALKAMNTSYMIKAGGVEAEHIRQVLAYDTLKQLLEEVTLYGIPLDMSLGEPTICFGQKHYRIKTPVFREPLSNPAQTRSLILVEPKKHGRSFREIVNGDNTNKAIGNHLNSISAANTSPFKAWTNTSTPQMVKKIDKPQQTAEQKQKLLELETMRTRAAAAEALLLRERQKVEVAMEKKRQEEAAKQASVREEQQRALKKQEEEERKRHEIEKTRNEILKREEQERARKEQERIKREEAERLKQKQLEERLRKENEAAEAARRDKLQREKLAELAEKFHRHRVAKTNDFIKQKMTPCIHRVRERIEKRNTKALERHRMWHFDLCVGTLNPYSSLSVSQLRPLHSTHEGIKKRVSQCMLAEKYALEHVEQPLQDHQSSIWQTENFSLNIYPRIHDKIAQPNQKQEWQLLVHVADIQLDSSKWFCKKFGLDDEFHSRKDRYQDLIITSRMITPESDLPSKWVDETGAIIFSLPESTHCKSPQEIANYWCENKQRLDKLIADLQKYNLGKQIPILFTYFPDDSNTESTLEKIPTYLGLDSNRSISDYHFLFMNPLTIATRIIDEVNWLSAQSLSL